MLNQHSKKHHHAGPPNIVPDSLVDPGNPSHRYQARSTAHLDRPCSRMVALAASSPGRRTPRSPQTKNATVMLRLGIDLEENFSSFEVLVGTALDRHFDHPTFNGRYYRHSGKVNARVGRERLVVGHRYEQQR